MTAPAEAFVGRDRELETLRAALDAACAGSGRLAMLSGEPGIGKTRLARELTEQAAALRPRVVWGRCHEEAGAPPYWPWVHILRAIAADLEPASAAHRTGRRRARYRRSGAGAASTPARPGAARPAARSGRGALPPVRLAHPVPCQPVPAPAARAGARRPALGRHSLAAPAGVPRAGDRRQQSAGDRHLPRHRAVATAPPVRHAGCPGAGAACCAPASVRAEPRGSASASLPPPSGSSRPSG